MAAIQEFYKGEPPVEESHLSSPFPQFLPTARPFWATLIWGNKTGRKFSPRSWQFFLSFQATPHTSHLICLSYYVFTFHILNKCFQMKELLAISTKISPSQVMFFNAITLSPHRIRESVKCKMSLHWTKHFWKLFISWEMHDRWYE